MRTAQTVPRIMGVLAVVQMGPIRVRIIRMSQAFTRRGRSQRSLKVRGFISMMRTTTCKERLSMTLSKALGVLNVYFSLKIGDIHTNLLQAVFDGDKRAFESDIMMTKQTQHQKDHERDLLLAFWLAVHVENVELTHFMVKNEPLIKKLVTYLFLK